MVEVERTLVERVAGLRRPLGIAVCAVFVVYAWLVWQAPVDRVQGIIQKILYVHPRSRQRSVFFCTDSVFQKVGSDLDRAVTSTLSSSSGISIIVLFFAQ